MYISRLKLKNWRNFADVDVALQPRQFIVGPNASGKSNLLDVFRFLRDVAKRTGGGLQGAIDVRGGVSKIRCFNARRMDSAIEIGIVISDSRSEEVLWQYEIGIRETKNKGIYLEYERVWEGTESEILNRPSPEDDADTELLRQTHLEQASSNQKFRAIWLHLGKATYTDIVPQLLRHSSKIQGMPSDNGLFGQGFLQSIMHMLWMADSEKERKKVEHEIDSRLDVIGNIVKAAVPGLLKIEFERDPLTHESHVVASFSTWRRYPAKVREDQFSDGTLRLIAFAWDLLEGDSLLLLEEPEISLHAGFIERLAGFLYRIQRDRNRQVLINTHSKDLLSDPGIGAEEVLVLTPTKEGTEVKAASNIAGVRDSLVKGGLPVGDLVIPRTKPETAHLLK